jgi:hypothetical protein
VGADLTLEFVVGSNDGAVVSKLPIAAFLKDSTFRSKTSLDGRHLIFALAIQKSDQSLEQGGFLIVRCQGDDLTKIDDRNLDGKIDANDIYWVSGIEVSK